MPYPSLLRLSSNARSPVQFKVGGGDVRASFKTDFPLSHLAKEGPIDIPKNVPFIGGKLGLTETFSRFEGEVSSAAGTGSLTLSGQTGFTAADQTLTGKVSGKGNFLLQCQDGLQLDSATFNLNLTGKISKEAGVADAIPQLVALQRAPVIGRAVQWFNKRATLTGEVEPSLDFNAKFKQDAGGNLKFDDGTGTLGLNLKAILQGNLSGDRLSASGYVAGGGSSTLGVPAEPFVRELKITFEAGVELKLDYLIKKNLEKKVAYNCTWTPESGSACGQTEDEEAKSSDNFAAQRRAEGRSFSVITRNYAKFGEYAAFHPQTHARPAANSPLARAMTTTTTAATTTATPGETLVSNLFPGAAPTTIAVGDGQLVLWSHAEPGLPATRANAIAWSYRSDAQGAWSVPGLIASDTQAEFSPVAGVDGAGRVVAAWLRVKDPNFSESIETTDDIARFYGAFEVVTATFDPATRAWSNVTALTDDAALDTNLRLSADDTGGLLLTWLSNPNAELMSTEASPSTLKYSLRTGAGWSAPATIATSLVGVGSHAAARDREAFVIVPRDPDADAANDGVLELYRWSGGGWSAAQSFAGGGVENRLPAATYDGGGEGRIVWMHGDDLVSASSTMRRRALCARRARASASMTRNSSPTGKATSRSSTNKWRMAARPIFSR